MHYFLVDETNKTPKPGTFFVVGGLVFTDNQASVIDDEIERIRQEFGYQAGDSLKFDTNARPSHVSIADAQTAKTRVIAALRKNQVRMIVYLVLHDLCGTQTYDTKMNYALNTLVGAYWNMLRDDTSHGMLFIDRDNDRYDHLEHLFQTGLQIGGRNIRVRDSVKFIGMTSDNASHLSSATDIALGGFRYCVNAAGGTGKDAVARTILGDLVHILWVKNNMKGEPSAAGYGFHLRPKDVRAQAYKEKYASLVERLSGFLVNVEDSPPTSGSALTP